MHLEVIAVNGHGDENEEFVRLAVLKDCDLVNYAVADTTYTDDDHISNELRHFFWFPSTLVKAGEEVVLRTKVGEYKRFRKDDGTIVHRFYWNLDKPIWNDDEDGIVLFKIDNWQASRA